MVPLLARYPYSIALCGVYVSPGITWFISLMNSLQKFAPAEKNHSPTDSNHEFHRHFGEFSGSKYGPASGGPPRDGDDPYM